MAHKGTNEALSSATVLCPHPPRVAGKEAVPLQHLTTHCCGKSRQCMSLVDATRGADRALLRSVVSATKAGVSGGLVASTRGTG